MKPGPYKSSTHGPINVSMKARELLLANQLAAQTAIANGEYSTNKEALSRSRGEIAKYIGELEANQRGMKTATEVMAESQNEVCSRSRATYDRLLKLMNETPRWPILAETYKWGDFPAGMDFSADSDFNPLRYKKEPTVNEEPKKDPIPKTRSELLGEATHELVQAQTELEYILKDATTKPDAAYVSASTGTQSVGSYMRGAVAELVREQWTTLVKKAVARAKARVAKAEKAVAALLGS